MRFSFLLTAAALLHVVWAQSSASATPSAIAANSTTFNNTLQTITTTITSLVPGPSGSTSATSFLTLTLTLNSSLPANSTLTGNGTTISGNGTLVNGTAYEAWKEGDEWLPFNIKIDPAYGVLGALLILSGLPVAGLGGKNRW
jgi:hypothetical protein